MADPGRLSDPERAGAAADEVRPGLVDWSRTRAWGDGGYYGRLFLNMRGREPQGIVPPEEVEALKAELTTQTGGAGRRTRRADRHACLPPGADLCRMPQCGARPDRLFRRPALALGRQRRAHDTVWTHENDTGPDDANHAQQGIFLMAHAGDDQTGCGDGRRRQREASRSTMSRRRCSRLRHHAPPGMGRRLIARRLPAAQPDDAYTAEEEEELARRLEDLGYL